MLLYDLFQTSFPISKTMLLLETDIGNQNMFESWAIFPQITSEMILRHDHCILMAEICLDLGNDEGSLQCRGLKIYRISNYVPLTMFPTQVCQ